MAKNEQNSTQYINPGFFWLDELGIILPIVGHISKFYAEIWSNFTRQGRTTVASVNNGKTKFKTKLIAKLNIYLVTITIVKIVSDLLQKFHFY